MTNKRKQKRRRRDRTAHPRPVRAIQTVVSLRDRKLLLIGSDRHRIAFAFTSRSNEPAMRMKARLEREAKGSYQFVSIPTRRWLMSLVISLPREADLIWLDRFPLPLTEAGVAVLAKRDPRWMDMTREERELTVVELASAYLDEVAHNRGQLPREVSAPLPESLKVLADEEPQASDPEE